MLKTIKRISIAASTIVGASAIATAPAFAYNLSGSDVLRFEAVDTNNDGLLDTTQVNQSANLDSLLAGNCNAVAGACSPAGSPGGNIELFASSEQLTLNQFLGSSDRTSINGTVGGKALTISSLTATDWFGAGLNTSYFANTFARTWFDSFYNAAGLAGNETLIRLGLAQLTGQSSWLFAPSSNVRAFVFDQFKGDVMRGFQRSSDPNISYITTSGSDLKIGLAGHYDAKAFYTPYMEQVLPGSSNLIRNGFQVSEVAKVNYGGVEQFLFGFNATESGLVNAAGQGADGLSHNGNYEFTLGGVVPPASVPEPSTMLGLMAVGGMVVASKRKAKKTA